MRDLGNSEKAKYLDTGLKNLTEILAFDDDKFNRYIIIYDSKNKESDTESIIKGASSKIESIVMEALSKPESNKMFSTIATVNDALKNETPIILVKVIFSLYLLR
jgi:hypothetical protein